MMRFAMLLVLTALMATPSAAAEDEEMRAVRTLIAFDKTCIETTANPAAVKKLVAPQQPFALPPLAGPRAETFLAGRPGAVWHLPPQLGEAALAVTDDGTCTVFLAAIDPEVLLGVAEAWWEKHSTYALEPARQTEAAYVSRLYRLVPRKAKAAAPPLMLTISLAAESGAPYQAALSVTR